MSTQTAVPSSPPNADESAPLRENPFVGFRPMREDDAGFFFGRSADLDLAVSLLQTWRVVILHGPSGVGKSSFVRAGLLALRAKSGTLKARQLLMSGREIAGWYK